MTADIEKAFLQIVMNEQDRDAWRFFWFDEALSNAYPVSKPKLYRMKRLPFGARASPFILTAVIRKHLESVRDEFPVSVSMIERNLYVDDLIVTVQSEEMAKKLRCESIEIFSRMKMNLRKWTIGESNEEQKVLGVCWDRSCDVLQGPKLDVRRIPTTMREVASLCCSLWDPMGLYAPVFLQLKLVLQSCWKFKLPWDGTMPETLCESVRKCLDQFCVLNSSHVERCIAMSCESLCYRVFCDASQKAYGAAVYACSYDACGTLLKSSLMISKSRLTPNQKVTIPRLELMAMLLGARLLKFVEEQCGVGQRIQMFSDSKVALCWVKNKEKCWKDFVQNRVNEIVEKTNRDWWSYVPTELNPADLISRGCSASELSKNSLWWHGPMKIQHDSRLPTTDLEEKARKIACFATAGEPLFDFSSCLLYTSPSPRDRQKSRMPSSA